MRVKLSLSDHVVKEHMEVGLAELGRAEAPDPAPLRLEAEVTLDNWHDARWPGDASDCHTLNATRLHSTCLEGQVTWISWRNAEKLEEGTD